jgi:hypothetical protein
MIAVTKDELKSKATSLIFGQYLVRWQFTAHNSPPAQFTAKNKSAG